MPVIGFLGVGHIAADLIAGLLCAGRRPETLLLSPRGRETAQALHRAHGIPIATDNAALVAASDIVMLCVRPKAAVAAGIPRSALATAAAPAEIVRAMPVSAARFGASPTTLHPDETRAHALLAQFGPVLPVADEVVFERATLGAAMYGWVFALIGESTAWLEGAGLDPAQARALAAGTFAAAAAFIAGDDRPVPDLLAALATPGGITEAGLDRLRKAGALPAWHAAFDSALARVTMLGQPLSRPDCV